MSLRPIPSRGGAVTVYGMSRLSRLEWQWRTTRPVLLPAALAAGVVGFGLVALGWPGLGAILVMAPLAGAAPVALILIARPRTEVAGRDHLKLWWSVEQATTTILRSLPALGGLMDVRQADRVVRVARWEIACLLWDRSRVIRSRNEATWSAYGLPPEHPLRAELAQRRETLDGQASLLDEQARQRAATLQAMAREAAAFAHRQGALRRAPTVIQRARRAVERADTAVAETVARWQLDDDPAAELADRTSAVLSAYRELSTLTTNPSDPD